MLRRTFLASISILAITAVRPARAWIRGNAGTPKVQIGTTTPDSSAFKNFMVLLQSFQASTAGYAYPAVLNVDQYPVGTIGSTLFGSFPLPSNLTNGTTLVLAWTGTAANATGAMQLSLGAPGFTVTVGSGFVVGGTGFNLTVAGTNGYIEFNFVGAPPLSLTFDFLTGSTFTNLSGLIVCNKSDYASIIAAANAGQLLTSSYVNSFKALHPKYVRGMTWTDPNDLNNFTQHKYRNSWQTALAYGPAWIPNCWAGSSSGTNAYTAGAATDTPGSYTLGEVLQLQFINVSTSTPLTINVGSRGVVPLFDNAANALTSIAANALATLIYDDLLGGYLTSFGGLTANIPVEVQIGLANQVAVPLWYNLSSHITYSSVTAIASLISSTSNSGCLFEYSNEMWNNKFSQTTWAAACGVALGFPSGNNRQFYGFYALKVAQIMPLVTAAWGAKAGLKCISAFQAFGPTGTGGLTNLYRLQGADLSTALGYTKYNSYVGVNYNASPNRPIDVSDTLSYATYYSGAQCANFDANYANVGGTGLATGGPASGPGSALSGLLGAADAYAAGGSTNIANAIAWLDWDIRQGTNNGTAGGQTILALKSGANGIGIYPPWETIAASYDGAGRPGGKTNLTVELYEGALECAPPSTAECTTLGISTTYGGATGKIGNLLAAYKQSATFYVTVQQQFADFFAQPHSKTAAWFTLTGGTQWSLYQPPGDVYSPVWQSYSAVQAYNQTP